MNIASQMGEFLSSLKKLQYVQDLDEILKDIFEMQKYNIPVNKPVIEFSLGNFVCKFSRFNQKLYRACTDCLHHLPN